MLKRVPTLQKYSEKLTLAMIEFYLESQLHFTSDKQPHYIYSPRELTRWKYAINEALDGIETIEHLVRLWAHEAARLFYDRLVNEADKAWCDAKIDEIAKRHFDNCNF